MKIQYYLFICAFSLACESSQESGQVRERTPVTSGEQGKSDSGSNGNTDSETEKETETDGNSSSGTKEEEKNPALSASGSIDEEFRVPSGPTGYVSRTVTYGQGAGGALKGFYMRPSSAKSGGAGLIAIHGLQGLNEDFKRNLMRYVARGYKILAIDLYEGKLPGEDGSADNLYENIQSRGKTDIFANITSGVDYLAEELGVRSLGVVGWGEGGYWAIETMISFPSSFAALVNYEGSPFELSRDASNIPIPTFHVFSGEVDSAGEDSPETLEKLELEASLNEKTAKKIDFRFYKDVELGFLAPSNKASEDEKDLIHKVYDHSFSYLDKYLKQQ